MRKIKRRIACLALALLMLVSMIPIVSLPVSAASALPAEGIRIEQDGLYTLPKINKEFVTFESELWIDPKASNSYRHGIILGNYTDQGGWYYEINFEIVAGGFMKYFNEKCGNVTFKTDLRDYTSNGKFVKVAVVIDKTNESAQKLLLYINGELKETATKNDSGKAINMSVLIPAKHRDNDGVTGYPMMIGGDYRTDNAQYFKGKIKNITVYSDIRTAGEIENSGKAASYSVDASDTALIAGYDLTAQVIGKDSSVNAYDATFTPCSGITFSNSDEKLDMEQSLSDVPLSFETWIYLPTTVSDSSRGGCILSNYHGDYGNRLSFEIHQYGRPRIYYNAADGKDKSAVFTDVDVRTNGWVYLAIVIDEENDLIRCYINGVEACEPLTASQIDAKSPEIRINRDITKDNPLCIGSDYRASYAFKGTVRELALYSKTRTASEIANTYANGFDASDSSLISYYDAREANNDYLFDLTGNGHDCFKTWLDNSKYDVNDYAYTFAVVGDTQRQAYSDWQTSIDSTADNETAYMAQIYDWIVSNKESQKIELVLGMGDITEKNNAIEWDIAYDNITKLEAAGIPYHIIMGNHDKTAQLDEKFKAEKNFTEADIGYYSGDSLGNYYMRFVIGGTKYMVVGIEYGANDDILDWVGQVADANPDHIVIVTTHAYMFRDGTTLDKGDVVPPNSSGVVSGSNKRNNGDMMFDKLMSKHRNILMVLSGHDPYDSIAFRQDKGENGNLVSQFLIDPQGMEVSLGMVALLHFSADGKQVAVEWYSTGRDQYYKYENQFTFDLIKDEGKGICYAELVKSENGVDTHRIYYSNGTYSEFTLANGKNGSDITVVSVEHTGTDGLVDTYTVTYSNSSTTELAVTNGKNGKNGLNGITPSIGENGNWFMGDNDTGKPALAYDGTVISVKSFELTGSDGLTDTYTITYSDDSVTTLKVVNGEDGAKGEKGETGHKGLTGEDGEDGAVGATGATGATGAAGAKGAQGANGNDGKNVAVTPIVVTTLVAAGVMTANIAVVIFFILSSKKKGI